MKNILFVNNSEESCGVYQFGKRVANIFKRSSNYNAVYSEPKNALELRALVQIFSPRIIIYNYLPMTMPWLSANDVEKIRLSGIASQGLIVHNIGYVPMFDFYLHQNPAYPRNGKNYPLLRPLFDYDEPFPVASGKIKIGSFGFGFKHKRYEEICRLVSNEFDEAEINMNLTLSHFFPNHQELEEVKAMCRKNITKPGIELNFSSDFCNDANVLSFLAGNDLNIFLYQDYDRYNGISSVIDYALSVRRPIAVCKSNMFSHINKTQPSICVEDVSLASILRNGASPTEKLRQAWSNKNFVNHFEEIIQQL